MKQHRKLTLPFVEMMVTQACNISCHGCTNYSDLKHSDYLTWEQGRREIESWLTRVDIPDFGIIGGEPLLNPDIRNWIAGLRQLLPDAQIRFTTNGLLLKKHYDIVKLLADIGNCVFKIGVHVNDPELEDIIEKIYSEYHWRPVTEFGVQRHEADNRFRFHVRRPEIFWKTYQGTYFDMMPHNSDPESAFSICCQQTCPLLYNGRLYKCSTAGLLKDTLQKVGNPNLDHWAPFIPDGLSTSCHDQELAEFIDNFGKPSQICRQCPSPLDVQSQIAHLENVSKKKISFYKTIPQ
jgi:organic radical activating enzyme